MDSSSLRDADALATRQGRRLRQTLISTGPGGSTISTGGASADPACAGFTLCTNLVPLGGCPAGKEVLETVTGSIKSRTCVPCRGTCRPQASPAPAGTPDPATGAVVVVSTGDLAALCAPFELVETPDGLYDVKLKEGAALPDTEPLRSGSSVTQTTGAGGSVQQSVQAGGGLGTVSQVNTSTGGGTTSQVSTSTGPGGTSVNVAGPGTCPPGQSVTMVNGRTYCDGVPTAPGGVGTSAGPGSSIVVVNGRVFVDGVEIPPADAAPKEGDACACVVTDPWAAAPAADAQDPLGPTQQANVSTGGSATQANVAAPGASQAQVNADGTQVNVGPPGATQVNAGDASLQARAGPAGALAQVVSGSVGADARCACPAGSQPATLAPDDAATPAVDEGLLQFRCALYLLGRKGLAQAPAPDADA